METLHYDWYECGDRPTIFTNGCFDILHSGHFRFLKFCEKIYKNIGKELIIGLDSDEKIRKDKGEMRPFLSWEERADELYSVLYDHGHNSNHRVSIVGFNTREGLEDLIKKYKPIIIASERWRGEVVGEEFSRGIIYFGEVRSSSTTKIAEKVIEKYLQQFQK